MTTYCSEVLRLFDTKILEIIHRRCNKCNFSRFNSSERQTHPFRIYRIPKPIFYMDLELSVAAQHPSSITSL